MFNLLRFFLYVTVAVTIPLPTFAKPTSSTQAHRPPLISQLRIQLKTYNFPEAGGDIEYAFYIPSTYIRGEKVPLVVALHGLFSTPLQIMWYPGLTNLAEKHGMIVVAPMGYDTGGWYGAKPVVDTRQEGLPNYTELSERDVLNVLEIMQRDYTVDKDRIYLLGHSMGGGGTLHLGVKYPKIWAALAAISPATLMSPDRLSGVRHLPVILVTGERDRLVKVHKVRALAEQMKKLEMKYEYIEVPAGDHVSVAFRNLPKIFEFLSNHKRGD